MLPEIAIYGIMVVVGVAIFTSLAALWYRSGRAVTRPELDAVQDRIDARFNRTDELITNNTNQLRAEMAANRAEFLAEMTKNRDEMAANRAESRAEMAANRAEFLAEMNKNREEMAANRAESRAEMAAGRAELLAELAKNREEMAAGRAEVLAEIAKNRIEMRQDLRQAVLDLTQAIANHQHDPDGRVSVVMVAEPQSGYETNRPAE